LRLDSTSYECPESSYTSSDGCVPIPPCDESTDSSAPCSYTSSEESSCGWEWGAGGGGRYGNKKPAARKAPAPKRPMRRDISETSEVVRWPNAFGMNSDTYSDE